MKYTIPYSHIYQGGAGCRGVGGATKSKAQISCAKRPSESSKRGKTVAVGGNGGKNRKRNGKGSFKTNWISLGKKAVKG